LDDGVVEVAAVPRQQKIHLMHGGYSDMNCITNGSGRNKAGGQDARREFLHLAGYGKDEAIRDGCEPLRRRVGIAPSRFVQDLLGDARELVAVARFPPFPGFSFRELQGIIRAWRESRPTAFERIAEGLEY
jgi:hypothetical protein